MADQVVAPIERAIQSVGGVDQVRSTSANSIGFVTAQFEYGTDVDEATTAMEEAIAALGLPDGVEPIVSALNINASPVDRGRHLVRVGLADRAGRHRRPT